MRIYMRSLSQTYNVDQLLVDSLFFSLYSLQLTILDVKEYFFKYSNQGTTVFIEHAPKPLLIFSNAIEQLSRTNNIVSKIDVSKLRVPLPAKEFVFQIDNIINVLREIELNSWRRGDESYEGIFDIHSYISELQSVKCSTYRGYDPVIMDK